MLAHCYKLRVTTRIATYDAMLAHYATNYDHTNPAPSTPSKFRQEWDAVQLSPGGEAVPSVLL
jgi:hypothetical protein